MDALRFYFQDRFVPGRGATSGLLHHEGKWRTFVGEAKLAIAMRGIGRVKIDAAIHQDAMQVGDQRAGIAQSQWASSCRIAFFHIIDKLSHALRPLIIVPEIRAVITAAGRTLDIFVREKKLPQLTIERKAVDAMSRGVDQ